MAISLSVKEAVALINEKKETVVEMQWKKKRGGYNPNRYIFESALKINSEIREDLLLNIQYRSQYTALKNGVHIPKHENLSTSLLAGNQRIFAYDYDYDKEHFNKIGEGKPFFRKRFIGLHQHIWTNEGYGYAEPLYLTRTEPTAIIKQFISAANINIPGGVVDLPPEQFDLIF